MNFDNYRHLFRNFRLTEMAHAVRINDCVDIHRSTPYVFNLISKAPVHFKTYKEAVEYALLTVSDNPAKEDFKKLETKRTSYQEFKHSKKYKDDLTGPEHYHWNNNIHEKSDEHLYLITNGEAVKIGKSKSPEKRLKELQTGNPGKLEILCIIKNKGFLEKTLHRCFKDIKLEGEWFIAGVRIAKFMNLTRDWQVK